MTELFPEIAMPHAKDDDQPSCSAAESLTRQEPFINQNLAYQALGMLTQLLRPRHCFVSRRILQPGNGPACPVADSSCYGHSSEEHSLLLVGLAFAIILRRMRI